MNGQPIRWPELHPRLIVGGCDTGKARSERFLHLGPFAFAVEHASDGGWAFRFGKYFGGHAQFSLTVRV